MLMNAVKTRMRQPYQNKNVIGGNYTGSADSNSYYHFFVPSVNAYVHTGSSSGSFNAQVFMDVGFGDTAVTADDEKLADGNMTLENTYSGASSWTYKKPLDGKEYLTIVSQANNTKVDGEIINKTVVYRNDSENTVTIKEVGIYWNISSMNYTQSASWNNINGCPIMLAFRKVLTTPVVMAPGDVYAVTYRISLNI